MKKYQKLYQLKQIVKLESESGKYYRLTRKLKHNPEYDVKRVEVNTKYSELIADSPIKFKYIESRFIHIAYSMLKGKKYSQVENSVKSENELIDHEWNKIVEIMKEYKDEENSVKIPSLPFPTTTVHVPKEKSRWNNEKDVCISTRRFRKSI